MVTKKDKSPIQDWSEMWKNFLFTEEKEPDSNIKKTEFLLSTDTLSWYWLDLIFQLIKETWFDGVDLAIWKNFDAQDTAYVRRLSQDHDLPVRVIQTSDNLNEKEINKALDLCIDTGADTITINAPKMFNNKAYDFIVDNLPDYRRENKDIHFAIINPEDSNFFALPIPKYHFTNIVDIIKKYGCYLWLDIANLDSNALENDFMRNINDFAPYIATLYLSDKTQSWEGHVLLWEGVLKLPTLLKKIKENWYSRYFSLKLNISKSDLADSERVKMILKKAKKYFEENYEGN